MDSCKETGYDRQSQHQFDSQLRVPIEDRGINYAISEQYCKIQPICENLPGISLIISPLGKILAVNSLGASRLGYEVAELIDRSWFDILAQTERGSVEMELDSCWQAGAKVKSCQLQFQSKNGELIQVNAVIQCIELEAGVGNNRAGSSETICLLFAQEKIADLRQALQESEAGFKSLVEATPSPLAIYRISDRQVLYANSQFTQTFNLPEAQVIGQPMPDFCCDPVEANTLQEILLATGKLDRYEMQVKQTDGTSFWVAMSARILNFNGESAILQTFDDITERRWVIEAVRQQVERERLVSAMRDRIRDSLNLAEILNTTAAEVRQFLKCDRVVLFQFAPDWSGQIAVEAVNPQYRSILGEEVRDTCFAQNYVQQYQQGRIRAIEDIYTAQIDPCHVELLAQFQVKANLVVPILQTWEAEKPKENTTTTQLWGLLIAHHCSGPRQWQQWETDLLSSLAGQVAIAIKQAQLYQQLETAKQRWQQLAICDELTQVANRRRFDEYLNHEWHRHARTHSTIALILCDIDFFKAYNDTYGHLAGDFCLQQVAQTIHQAVQYPADLVARYGGEEFAVILPDTDRFGAVRVAERIRAAVKQLKIEHVTSPFTCVTLSLGATSIVPIAESSVFDLVVAADNALYQAKELGRDRVVLK